MKLRRQPQPRAVCGRGAESILEASAMTPNVRVEMRKVYVFGKRSARLTKSAAYRSLAAQIVRAACDCYHGDERDGHLRTVCRFHERFDEITDRLTPDGHVQDVVDLGEVYRRTVQKRLARFLAFVDRLGE